MQDKWPPSSAMVLAAGYGRRMRPLTDGLPKPLIKFAGKPLIDHVLDRLAAAGVAKAVVNTHYLGHILKKYLARRKAPEILISDETQQLLDTGGGIKRALGDLGPAPFIVHNSDSVWIENTGAAKSNLERMIELWDGTRMDSLLMLADARTSVGYDGRGDFDLLSGGLLKRRAPDGQSPFVFTGVSIVHPRLFDNSPDGVFSIVTLWDRAIARGRLYGMRHEGRWMHVGTPEALAEAERSVSVASS